ncbi:MAG TPA: arginine repressor [Candidatus Limnocylindria bacterium]|nr:arginine repressor [Candidatus Limnocylindria bacterium]
MRDALARKQHRQRALLRVVAQRRLATQGELARALRGAGFPATQATISRDIVELGLVKVTRDGTHAYAAPAAGAGAGGGTERLRRFCEDYPVEAAAAGNIVVVRSLPGTASALGAAIDAAGLDGIVGTIAGDDTVFVAVEQRSARPLLAKLATFGVRRNERRSRGDT